jgi:hypothetical protein
VKSKTLRLVDAAKILEELPANEETLEAVSRRRSEESAAPQRGTRFEPREAGRGSAADPEEVFGNGAGAIWSDAGSGALNGLMREFTAVLSHSWYNAASRLPD